jgi:hypothetical protein
MGADNRRSSPDDFASAHAARPARFLVLLVAMTLFLAFTYLVNVRHARG